MQICYKLVFSIFLLALNFFCTEKKTPQNKFNEPKSVRTSITDTLKFTSGIHSIYQDSRGNYWFGSHGEGVCRFNGKSFDYFTTNEGLSDNHILSIQEDKNGTIWFGTLNGVSCYNGKTIETRTKTDNEALQSEWVKTETDLWFNAGTKEGVYRYDGHQLHYLDFPNPKSVDTGNVYSLTGLSKGKNNMVWFGTYAGVLGYNGSAFTIINDETLGYTNNKERVHVRSILEDSKRRLWIGNNGIGVLLKEGDSIINFSEKNGKRMPLDQFDANTLTKEFVQNTGLNSVFAIAEDKNGNIWFGDRDTGAWKYDGKLLTNYTIDEKLKSQMVWTIYEDQNKNLLFGMAYGGVYQFNGNSFERLY